MPKYRKKPLIIEAFRLGFHEVPEWFCAANPKALMSLRTTWYVVDTLEGSMRADPGDWVIKGIKGEIYPCKDEIFRKSYEPVEDI